MFKLQTCYNLLLGVILVFTPLISDADMELIEAARNGDSESVARLVMESVDVNFAEQDGTTALHWAAHRNDMGIADLLLVAEADVDVSNDYGVSPVYLACTNRSGEMVRKLLDAGADPNATLWNGESVLMNCARTGAADAIAALIEKGARLDAREQKKGQTALMWAAAEGHGDAVELLVKAGADIKARSQGGFTPLLYAARSGDLKSAQVLIDAGADPDESTPKHGNTLNVAAASRNEQLALFLLTMGANPDSKDESGISVLHYAVANGIAQLNGVRYDPVYRTLPDNMYLLAKALLEAGADPNVQISKMYRLGPDGSAFDMVGSTPFLLSAISADVQMMQLFYAHGADVNITGKGGTTAVMAAARAACTGACAFAGGNAAKDADISRAFEAVKAAVGMGIDVNAKNDDGHTAMHMAAFTGADPVVRLLAENGAEVNVTNNYGETPWSMASGISPVIRYRGLYGDHKSTAALLVELGATSTTREVMDPNAPPPPGQ
jgi:ankyrin repeat protein